MTHAFLTVAVPFRDANVAAVESQLDLMGNPATKDVRALLRDKGIHFMTMTVLPGDIKHGAFLIFEVSADEQDVVKTLITSLGEQICGAMRAAGLEIPADKQAALAKAEQLMRKHSHTVGQSLMSTPGICFTGTPGMSVPRIRGEYLLSRKVRDLLERTDISGTPLQILNAVRTEIAQTEFAPLMQQHSSPLLELPSASSIPIANILKGVVLFTWPYLVLAVIIKIAVLIYCGWVSATVVGALAIVGLLALAGAVYLILRRLEATDVPDNSVPDSRVLAEVIKRENHTQQNHLYGISVMKSGIVRNLVLRIVYWVIAQAASTISRPGFLGELGTIHFARWILLPGTNKLLFFSNFGGSWESYLEDFITKAHGGLTAVWSNTAGFPRTNNVFQDGATDGDRFKRWARRQQTPTRFWYSAYPYLTTDRIRLNTAIRQGLASATTEDEAAEWMSCIGSRPRSGTTIENREVQTILFGGLRYLRYSACLVVKLPANVAQAREWLQEMEPLISYGDTMPQKVARLIAFTQTGLRRLGCNDQLIDQFPIAFQEGMSVPHRAECLGDTGEDKPALWWWGHGDKAVDAAITLYGENEQILQDEIQAQRTRLEQAGGSIVRQIDLEETAPKGFKKEPFGFADGISQPIIKGTRRWIAESDAIHVVEPGEFILGYLDNRGFLPNTPGVPATEDPRNILPVIRSTVAGELPDFSHSGANAPRDLGRNGTYLVIRQLEQDVDSFKQFLSETAKKLKGRQGVPADLDEYQLGEWLAAKIVGRWRDGTSLVRYPHAPGTGWDGKREREPDNSFLFGAEDPLGERCPYGSHIRRTNPRESFTPGSTDQLAISNRHRMLRVGRSYAANPAKDIPRPGLMFMCINADIERQFEFIQQTWAMSTHFQGLDGEVDPILGRGLKGGRLTVPTEEGPLLVTGFKDFVTVRGGGYFFMPSRRAICYLAGRTSVTNWKYSIVGPQPEYPESVPEGEEVFDAKQLGL